jgi:hypothetical protein
MIFTIFKKELKDFVKKELKGIRPKTPAKGEKPSPERIKFTEKREELSAVLTNKMHPIFISWYKNP